MTYKTRHVEEQTLKYLRTSEIRAELCAAVGINPGDRFGDPRAALRKAHVVEIARALGVETEGDTPLEELTIAELYPMVCDAAGVDYNSTAGNQWGIGRPQLKAIYQTIANSPRVGERDV